MQHVRIEGLEEIVLLWAVGRGGAEEMAAVVMVRAVTGVSVANGVMASCGYE